VGRTVSIKLLADVAGYMSGMQRAAVATREFSGELNKAAAGGKAEQITRATAAIGIGMIGVAGAAVKFSMDFDKSMSAVKAATNDSSKSAAENTKNMTDLRAAALQAGKDTSFSATQAADGITELAKAGIKTADILHGGLAGALNLAAAGQMSVADASETAASAMTQFKLSGSAVPHIADLLAAGAGKAQGSVHDMGFALAQSGLVASQFGLSIEDTTGTLSAFAHAGLIGSDAGTSFKTMLLALANPAGKTKDTMDELGISAYDASGKFIGITRLAEELKTKLGGLTQAQRDAALAQIFGTDAIRAANVLYQEGGKGIQQWIGSVNDAGYASRTAATMTDNLAGDLERLKGSLETLAIQSGSGTNSGLRILVKGLDDLVGSFDDMPPAVGATVVVLAGIGGVLALSLVGFLKLRKAIAEAVVQLNEMGPAGERAATGLSRATAMAGKAGIALATLEIVGEIAKQFDTASANVDALTNSLKNFSDTGKVTGELSDVFGKNLDDLGRNAQAADAASHGFWGALNDIGSIIPGVSAAADTLNDRIFGLSFDKAKANMTSLDAALTSYMTTTNDAVKASDLWSQVLSKSGLDTEALAKLLPNAYAEVGKLNQAQDDASRSGAKMGADGRIAAGGVAEAGKASASAAAETKKYTTAAQAAAGAAKGQRDALKSLSDFMKAETDPVFGLIKAENDLKAAQDNVTKAIKEHGKKSKEAKDATREFALAAIALQGAVGDVSDNFNGKLSPALVNTLKKAGASKAEIKNLEQQFKDAKKAADAYDGNYVAKATAPGSVESKIKMNEAWAAAKGYDGTYTAKLRIDDKTNVGKKLADLLVKQRALASGLSLPAAAAAVQKDLDRNRQKNYATGGQVGGWSPHSRADNIPAWLTASEWVHPVDSVKYYGPQVMRAIQHRQVPREVLEGFATGQLGKMGDLPLGLADGGQALPFPVTVAHTRIPSWASVMAKMGGLAGPFLRAQNGKPYIWASAGPDGYDCSGIASAVFNLLHGRNPYHHTFSTASLPGGWFPKHGVGGPLTVAWSNPGEAPASSTTGHMMGMAGGLTFESTGSRGVHLGASTRHLTDFAHIAHYGQGGVVAMKNGGTITEPVFGIGASGRTYSFGENYMPEQVTPGWGAGGGNTYVISPVFSGPVGSRAQLQEWLTEAIDDLRRRGRM
jgi:TP901 family phage tail tape measure protein